MARAIPLDFYQLERLGWFRKEQVPFIVAHGPRLGDIAWQYPAAVSFPFLISVHLTTFPDMHFSSCTPRGSLQAQEKIYVNAVPAYAEAE